MGTYPYQYKNNLFVGQGNQQGTGLRINSTTIKAAIAFTSNGGTVKKYGFYVNTKAGTAGTFNIQVVKCTNSGTPTAINVSDTTTDLAMSAITTNKWVSGVFANQFTLTEGSVYALVVSGKTSQSATTYILLRQYLPLTKMKIDENNDQIHNSWQYNGANWSKNNFTAPFILLSSTNGYVDGKMHENASGLTLFKTNSILSSGEQVKFPETIVATSISFFYDWARAVENPGNSDPLSYKIYNNSGTLLASAGMTYPASYTGGNWYTYTLRSPAGVATALTFTQGQTYTFLTKCATDTGSYGFGATQSFVQTANPISAANLHKYAKWGTTWAYGVSTSVSTENLWGSFKTYNNATNGYYDMAFKLGSFFISGKAFSNLNTALPGAKIKLKSNGITVSSSNSNSSGNFIINTDYTGNLILDADYNDWEFNAQNISINYPLLPTATIVQGTESKWWDEDSATGQGRHFAFRNKITFSTPHGIIPVGYVGTGMPIRTGDRIVIGNNGEFNESIGWIASRGQYSFVVYRDDRGYHRIVRYDKVTKEYTSAIVGFSGSAIDVHFMPSCEIDKNNIVHVFFGAHQTGDIEHYYSNTPLDITSFTRQDITTERVQTYLWPKYRATDGRIYVFFRGDVGNRSYRAFVRQNSSATGWETPKYFAADYRYFIDPDTSLDPYQRSLYSAGVCFDDNGYCYHTIDYHYGYENPANDRWDYSLNFYYSTDMTVWRNINGTIVGYSTVFNSDPMHVQNPSYNYCCTSDGIVTVSRTNPGSSSGHKGYNTDSLSLTNLKWNNGEHNIYLPFFQFQSATGYLTSGQDLCVAYYDTSASIWKFDNITKKTGIPFYLSRSGSHGICKPSGEKQVFAMMNTSDATENPEWSNVEPVVFISTATYFGGSWKYKFIERNSMVGNGMMAIRNPHYYNNEVELIYGAGHDIVYYSDKNKYGYMRSDGNDVRMVYNGQEIPRVADSFNNLSSNIKFKIQKTIPSNMTFDTASNYYIYYGNTSTTNPVGIASANPNDIYLLFENFETYPDNSDLNNVSSWDKVSIGASNDYTFRVFANTESVTVDGNLIYFPSSYYTYSGLKACLMGDSTYGQSTVYCEKTIGTNITDCWIEGHVRRHYSHELLGNMFSFIGIKTGSGTIYALGQTSTASSIKAGLNSCPSFGYFNGSQWRGVSSSKPCNLYWNSPFYMKVSSVSGTTFYNVTESSTVQALYTLSTAKSFNKIIFGGTHAIIYNTTVFDLLKVYKI